MFVSVHLFSGLQYTSENFQRLVESVLSRQFDLRMEQMSDADALEFRIDEVLDKLEVLGYSNTTFFFCFLGTLLHLYSYSCGRFEVEQYCDGESHDPFEKELRRGWHSALFRTICVDLCKQLAMFSKLGYIWLHSCTLSFFLHVFHSLCRFSTPANFIH